jgi:hypothetical protein
MLVDVGRGVILLEDFPAVFLARPECHARYVEKEGRETRSRRSLRATIVVPVVRSTGLADLN